MQTELNVNMGMPMIQFENVYKSFLIYTPSNGSTPWSDQRMQIQSLPILNNLNNTFYSGQCSALLGGIGSGKSTLLKILYGTCLFDAGKVCVRHQGEWLNLAQASDQQKLSMRRHTLAYTSPAPIHAPKVSVIDYVKAPYLERGGSDAEAQEQAIYLMEQLHIPSHFWCHVPSTLSLGQQQKVKLCRTFITNHPVILLDTPAVYLDQKTVLVLIKLIKQVLARGSLVLGVFNNALLRDAVADSLFYLELNKSLLDYGNGNRQ